MPEVVNFLVVNKIKFLLVLFTHSAIFSGSVWLFSALFTIKRILGKLQADELNEITYSARPYFPLPPSMAFRKLKSDLQL